MDENLTDRIGEIIGSMIDALIVIGTDATIQKANRVTLNLLGYEEDELIGQPISLIFAREEWESKEAGLEDLIGKGMVQNVEKIYLAKDGREIPMLFSSSVMLDNDGNAQGVICTTRDITERKVAEDLMRVQRDLFAFSLASGLDETLHLCVETAISVSGMDCGGFYLVDATSGDLDLAFHQGLPLDFIKSAAHYEADSPNARLVMAGKPIYCRYEQLGVPLDETNYRAGLRAIAVIPVRYANQVVACLNIASHTLDEVPALERTALETIAAQMGNVIIRAKVEETLRESELRYRALFETAADGILVADIETKKFKYANPAICRMLSYTEDELKRMGVSDIHAKEDLANVMSEFEAQARGEKKLAPNIPCVRKDGTTIYTDITVANVSIDGRKCNVGFFTDITERKQSEEALRESEEKYRTLVENVNIGIYRNTGGPHGHFLQANPVLIRILGYDSVEEFMKVSVSELYENPPDRKRFVEKIKTQGFVENEELRLRKKDGTYIWASCTARTQYDANGEIQWIDGIIEDITMRKRAEEELLARQERLKAINKIAIEVAGMSNLNELLQTIIDRTRELVKAEMGVIVLVDPDTGAIGKALLSNYPIDNIPSGVEIQQQGVLQRIVDGEVIFTEDITQDSNYTALPDWHPQIHACIGAPVEFGGRLQAILLLGHTDEQFRFSNDDKELALTLVNLAAVAIYTARQFGALENLTSLQRKILDTAATAVFTVDIERRITSVNAAFQDITGFSEAEILGQHCCVLKGDPCTIKCVLYDPDRQKPIFRRECKISSKDGRRLSIFKNANLLYDEQGNITGGIESFVDVTELIEARETAETANRAKSEFLANMSHEIRTPMNGIIGMTELALDTELTSEQRRYLDMVMDSAEHLLTVINDILDFSKIEAGKLDLESLAFNLRDNLGDTIKTLALRAESKGLELACHIPAEAPDGLVGDSARLRQIIVNLVGNAIKFTERGEVVVSVKTESQTETEVCLHYTVTDTGVGIPEEKQQGIFNAFEQVDGSTTRNYSGTGLGLAISAQLVAMMGGEIWVESEVGKGSTFHFTARFGRREDSAVQPVPAGVVTLKDMPVLVVDDNATNRQILEEMLNNWQMKPIVLDSGRSALIAMELASKAGETFPLIILDSDMPDMNGFAVAERIKENPELSGATIMVLSSASQPGDEARCRELGITAYLTKPIKQSDLLDAIMTALGTTSPDNHKSPQKTDYSPAGNGQQLRILLAEDNTINQKLAVDMLRKRDHTVITSSDGREVLNALEKQSFDLVLMDIQMPEMDGFEATAAIREKEKETGEHVPIIAMTAHAMKGDRERCLEAGMDGYISKPLRAKEFFEAVENLVSTSTEAGENSLGEQNANEVFDVDAALENLDDMEQLMVFASMFVEECPRMLAQIREAVERRDSKQLEHSAHSFKGSVSFLTTKTPFEAALKLETIGKNGDMTSAGEALAELEEAVEQLKSALDRLWQDKAA